MGNNRRNTITAMTDLKPYYADDWATIYHGDCRTILPSLGRFDLCLTDPPYGIGINKSNRLSTSRGFGGQTWDEQPITSRDLMRLISAAQEQIIWGGNYYHLPPAKCFLVWDKENDGRDFADCEFAWTSLEAVARIFRKRPMNMDGGKIHPTQKPIDLMAWCIKKHETAQTIIDPYAGVCTTAVAGKQLGRRVVCIESNEAYCEAGAKRLSQEYLPLNQPPAPQLSQPTIL
jgi:site-specific DNA-methyltransferase (adenine-specific)